MASLLKTVGQLAITNALSDAYTVPANTTAIIKEIVFCNTCGEPITVDMYFVKSGGTAGVMNQIVKSMQLLPYETQFFGLSSFLEAGSKIKVQASLTNLIGMTISGVEMT